MWEEHPEYQKNQARMIGVLIIVCLALAAGSAVVERDRDSLKVVLLGAGVLMVVLGLLSGLAWLLVKVFTRGRTDDLPEKKNHDV
jgi:hypothetical protein